jgi:hypothetical protein
MEMVQHLQIKMLVKSLTLWSKLMVHNTHIIEEDNQRLL